MTQMRLAESDTRPGSTRSELPLALTVRERVSLASLGAVLFVLLVLAVCLEPDPRGLGTHQQLGLPPCTVKLFWGFRCPSCGMTTSWSYFMRGMLQRSWQANAGGFCLATAAVIACAGSLAGAVRGVRSGWSSAWARPLIASIGAVILIDWVMKLMVGN